MARARNNIARLQFEQRITVAEMMVDGATYDEIRAAVKSDKELHNRSFLAYQSSDEYHEIKASVLQQRKRFASKRIQAARIGSEHGVDAVIGVTEAVLVEQLQELIDSQDDDEMSLKEMSAAAAILNNLKQSKAETRALKLQRANDQLKADLAAQKERYEAAIVALTGSQNQKIDPVTVQNKLDQILGLKKK